MRIKLATNQLIIVLTMLALVVAACQRVAPVSINDIPIPPGATVLPQGNVGQDSKLATGLAQDATYRKQVGAGNQVSHKLVLLSQEAPYSDALNVYVRDLNAAGWSSGWGWVPSWQVYDRGGQTLIVQWLGGSTLLLTLNGSK